MADEEDAAAAAAAAEDAEAPSVARVVSHRLSRSLLCFFRDAKGNLVRPSSPRCEAG